MNRALRPTPASAHGMVCAGNPIAAAAGARMLERGGNAFDAALAASAVLTLTIPHMNGLGGDAFGLLHEAAGNRTLAVNGSGRAPHAATPEAYRARGLDAVPLRGPLSISTPGMVDAWQALAERARFPLADLFAPAIALARGGIPLLREFRDYAVSGEYARIGAIEPSLFTLYGTPETLATTGTLLLPALAETFERIVRDGLRAFYEGETAHLLAADLASRDALLSVGDLAAQRMLIQEPLTSATGLGKLLTCPPNTQGFLLNLMVTALRGTGSPDDPDAPVRFLNAKRRAFVRRDRMLGDPDLAPATADLLAPLDHETAPAPTGPRSGSADTTCLIVADGMGNAVSWVQSLYDDFGSGVVSPSTGIVLQNRLSLAQLDGNGPAALRPDFRPPHTLCPALIVRDGRPRLVLATPGGHGQAQTLTQIVLALEADPAADLQSVVEAPRLCQEHDGEVMYESRLPQAQVEAMRRAGYRLRDAGPWGREAGTANALGAALVIGCDAGGLLHGAADPRRDGYAVPAFDLGEPQ